MKPLLCLLLLLPFLSCDKTGCLDNKSLDGTWKMIKVKDNASSASYNKPPAIPGDVVITMVTKSRTAGILSGVTPANEIFETAFSYTSSGNISIPNLPMTKVTETAWGLAFVDNIRSAGKYTFNSDLHLVIQTAANTLTFQKQ